MRAGYGKRKRKKKKAGQAAGQGGGPAAAGGHGDGEPAAGGAAAAGGAEAAKKPPKPKTARQARQALKVRAKRNLKERIGALQSLRKTVKRNDPLGKSAVRDLTAKIKSAKAARRGLRKGTAGAAAKGGALLLGALDLGLGGGPEEEGEEGEEAGAAEGGAEDMEMS